MLRVKKEIVKKDCCSCNFCNKGTLKVNGVGLEYPYEEVYSFTIDRDGGSGLLANICKECLKELYTKVFSGEEN
ncbi:MAG: hypothetical protein M0R03_21395 [Novosphingobium sp.]|jgi:hypothetical protein|nr:hypothetical protein [Novosphingobium sp.]